MNKLDGIDFISVDAVVLSQLTNMKSGHSNHIMTFTMPVLVDLKMREPTYVLLS